MSSSDEEEASPASRLEGDAESSPLPILNPLPSRVVVTVGPYDGVLAGWELKDQPDTNRPKKLEISFATPVHGGSVRSLCLAAAARPNTAGNASKSPTQTTPGSLLSTGYDEMLKTHDFHRQITSSGEVRTPTDMGTPVCSSFAPPQQAFSYLQQQESSAAEEGTIISSTHCLVGFSSGKLVIYKKRDWSVQHVLAGHAGGVASLAVHPTGKLALSGGHADGKLKLWDLTKGRLSFVTKIAPSSQLGRTRATSMDPVVCTVWSADGSMYAYCHGNHITVRDVATGTDWCDVELPSRVNQIALMQGLEGIFVAAACNDGSLPVLAVKTGDDDNGPEEGGARRAIMAIEPIDGPVAGEERYKCIHTVCGYYVVTANSAGVISLMNLEGAVRMIMTDEPEEEENPADGSDNNSDDDNSRSDGGDEDLAVDIIDAVQLGSGARVTCLVAWACDDDDPVDDDADEEESSSDVEKQGETPKQPETNENDKKRKLGGSRQNLEMDPKEIEKARSLVAKAKKLQKRKDSKKRKLSPGE